MRAWWAIALASGMAAVATAPVAAQAPRVKAGAVVSKMGDGSDRPSESLMMASGRRIWKPCATYNRQALRTSDRLSRQTTRGDPKGDIAALGKSLAGEEQELNTLDRTATGADKGRLVQVRAHEKEARKHYDELLKATTAPARAQHAAAVHQYLLKVQTALTAPI